MPHRRFALAHVGTPGDDDLFTLGWSARADDGPAAQMESALGAALDGLAEAGAGSADVVAGRVFAAPTAIDAALAVTDGLPVTVVVQPPLSPGRLVEVALQAARSLHGDVVHRVVAGGMRTVTLARAEGRSVWLREVGQATAKAAFAHAADALAGAEMSFAEAVRTWIWVDGIYDRYAALNRARTDLFRRLGVDRLPASTGIGGAVPRAGGPFALDVFALECGQGATVSTMAPHPMGEANDYGSAFARGTIVTTKTRRMAFVSGTASIDAQGQVVAPGDLPGQLCHMFDNLTALLAGAGMVPADIVSGVAYLAEAAEPTAYRRAARRAGLPETAPIAVVRAKVCRPAWLCEIEVVAGRRSGPD